MEREDDMNTMFRRFIYVTLFFAFACVGQKAVTEKTEAYVSADIAPLKKVIVLSPEGDFSRRSYEHYSDFIFGGIAHDAGAIERHNMMIAILEENGVEILNILDLLEDAIANAKKVGDLDVPAWYSKTVKYIPDVGWLTHYKAGTGDAVELKIKLVDYLRSLGYEIIWVGGDRVDMREDKYLLERVMYELSMQAANVVQLEPGKILSYAHNKHTIQALRNNGIEVFPFEGKYLADNLGGPHCLTMTLLRRY
jgi:hypothetical protein